MSDGIFKWSFAFAPALLAIYVSLAYIGDGFDLSSMLLHLSVPWLVLAPSLAWLGVSFVICFESAKLNKVGSNTINNSMCEIYTKMNGW